MKRSLSTMATRVGLSCAGLVALGLATAAQPAFAQPSDWDLYMLRLVNRARQDPAGEAARLGSAVTDNRSPVPPLAFVQAVWQAATNHNNWMQDNFGNIASGLVPDSHTHYETLDGTAGGTPATGTPSYSGVSIGPRLTAAGYTWDRAGENILALWSTATIPVDQGRTVGNHRGWWESAGHRDNMLSADYTAFGYHAESRTFVPPRGGLNAPVDNIHFGTQNYGRPLFSPKTYVFGLLFDDMDSSGDWTPRNTGDPLREGVAGVTVEVYLAGASTFVAGGTTLANGAFAVNIGNGAYDLNFLLPEGTLTVSNVILSGQNINAGDIEISSQMCTPPVLLATRSVAVQRTGPATTAEFYIDLDDMTHPARGTSEPRDSGLRILDFVYDQALTSGSISISSGPDMPMTLLDGGTRGRVTLPASLANNAVYSIVATASTGPGCTVTNDICVTAMVGDFNSNGVVTAQDKAEMLGFVFQTITQANARYDLQVNGGGSGTIEVADVAAWTGFFGANVQGLDCQGQ